MKNNYNKHIENNLVMLRSICRKLLLPACFLVLPLNNAFAVFVNVQDIEDAHIKRIAISPFDENLIYVGSKNALFKSVDKGKKFQKIYVFKDEELSHIVFDLISANTAYVAATRHLYKITDKIDMVYRSADEETILSVAKYKDGIYIGTTGGLYFSSEDILKIVHRKKSK